MGNFGTILSLISENSRSVGGISFMLLSYTLILHFIHNLNHLINYINV